MPDTPPQIRRRKQIDRQKILAVASEQFRMRGYQGTSMDEIAAALSVKKPALYYRFKSKEDILLACVEQSNGLLDAGFERFGDKKLSGRARLEIFLRIYLEIMCENFIALFMFENDSLSEKGREMYIARRRISADYMQQDQLDTRLTRSWPHSRFHDARPSRRHSGT